MSKKKYPEDQIQRDIVGWLRGAGYLFTTTGAGLIKSVKTQIIMSGLGYTAGSPDIIVWIQGGTLNIECKAPKTMKYSDKTGKWVQDSKGGVQTPLQKEFELNVTQKEGHHYIIARDKVDVIQYIVYNKIRP